MKSILPYIVTFQLLFLFAACSSSVSAPQLDIRSLRSLPADEQQAPHPPTTEELRQSRSYIAVLTTAPTANVSRYARALSVALVEATLEEHGNLQIVPDYRVQQAQNQSSLFRENLKDPATLIYLAEILKVKYIALIDLKPSAQNEEGNWAANVELRIYQAKPTKTVLRREFLYRYSDSAELQETLRLAIQTIFPTGGFIVETRGGAKAAKINLGRRNGMEVGSRLRVFRRSVRLQKQADGTQLRQASYEETVGTIHLVQVDDTTAWGAIQVELGKQVLRGDAVFVIPRAKSGWF